MKGHGKMRGGGVAQGKGTGAMYGGTTHRPGSGAGPSGTERGGGGVAQGKGTKARYGGTTHAPGGNNGAGFIAPVKNAINGGVDAKNNSLPKRK